MIYLKEWKSCANCDSEKTETAEFKNCWEYLECDDERKEDCKVYKYNYGNKCWLLVDEILKGCSKSGRECFKCP